MSAWTPLLDWWFGPRSDDGGLDARATAERKRRLWFGYQASQDAEARTLFADVMEQALAGELIHWNESPAGWLARSLLLDQLPRMIHRDTPRAFSGDPMGLAAAEAGIAQGLHLALAPIERVFVYLPFEHAEDLASQDRAVMLFSQLRATCSDTEISVFDGFLDYAKRHHAVIERFGRFPHRNAILGLSSTPEERAFLQEPGSRF
jgi:uncharacterized protein (DUF924 family)